MKTAQGQYELSERQIKYMLNGISNVFEFDANHSQILHPTKINVERRHIDVVIGEKEEETLYVSFGCSARKIQGRPYSEVFAKAKNADSVEIHYICNNLIKDACFNDPDSVPYPPQYECALLNGYEFLFLDGYEKYHNTTGYWGLFICPAMKSKIAGMGEVQFYQIIPAYKEELDFVEQYAQKGDYKVLCKAIVEQISERQYFDVVHDKLSEEQLNSILASIC